MAAMTL